MLFNKNILTGCKEQADYSDCLSEFHLAEKCIFFFETE